MSSRQRLLLIVPLALALVMAFALGCGGGSSTPSASALQPAVEHVGNEVVVDLPMADRLYAEGSTEEAAKIYSAAVLRGTAEERQKGLLAVSHIQSKSGENDKAAINLRLYLQGGPSEDDKRPALLLLGTVQAARGDAEGASETLQQYIDAGGAAASYARLRLAEIAIGKNDAGKAVELAQAALADNLAPAFDTDARMALAGYQDEAGDDDSAAGTYGQLAKDAATSTDRAEAFWRLADLQSRDLHPDKAHAALAELAHEYPASQRALDALSNSAATGLAARDRALVLFQHSMNDEAKDAFTALAAAPGSTGGEAHYYLGILAERGGDPDGAIAEYDQAISQLSPDDDGEQRVQAYWDRATVLESLGRTDEAIESYVTAVDGDPSVGYADDTLFKVGFLRYQQGRPDDARAFWTRLAQSADTSVQARAEFWLAKTDASADDAASHYQAAIVADPLGYYGMRARAIQEGTSSLPPTADVPPTPPPLARGAELGWAPAVIWLLDWAGPEPTLPATPGASDTPSFDRTGRAFELLAAGLSKEADAEFSAAIDEAGGDPWRLYRLARTLSDRGLFGLAARAGGRLAAAHADPPPAIVSLAYPLAYGGLVQQYAQEQSVPALLLLALVRQESLYDPAALSPAEAAGLTQVVPSTAAEIAQQLGEKNFTNVDLFRPRVSLRFGAYYLGAQLSGFGGNIPAALAAYNGGAGNAGRWVDAAVGDPDLFLESIDFGETRVYDEVVLANYALYLYAYGLTPTPSLPLP